MHLFDWDSNNMNMDMDMDMAEMFYAFIASACNTDDGLKGSQCPELENCGCENEKLPVDPELLQDLLFQLDPSKSMGPDGIQGTFKELGDSLQGLL